MRLAIGTVHKSGVKYYRVQWQHEGVRREKYHRSMQDARNFVEMMKRDLALHGHAGNLAPDKRADAITALALLEEKGLSMSLTEAVKIASEVQGKNVPRLSEALEKWMAIKKSEGHTPKHTLGMERVVGLFVALHAEKRPGEITTGDVDKFLAGFQNAGKSQWTIKTYLRDLTTFFTWCHESQEWCRRNPAAHAAKQNTKGGKIHILTPAKAKKLLRSCSPEIVPAVAVQMFCPVRFSEIKKMDWSAIDLCQKVLTIDKDIAKTKTRRVMSIPDNAVKILKKCKSREGGVLPQKYIRLFDEAKIVAGFLPTNRAQHDLTGKELAKWPNNVLRHSAISYTLAVNGDIYKTATSAGNSPKIVQEHYLQLVKPADATAYFEINE